MTGLELEVNLIDDSADPAMINHEVLAALGNPQLKRELGKFNIEFNARPRLISGAGLVDYERDILATLSAAEQCARSSAASLVMCGIMPTLTPAHAVLENLSPELRYLRLNDQIME